MTGSEHEPSAPQHAASVPQHAALPYRQLLADASFTDIDVEVTRVYEPEHPVKLDGGQLVSAFIRATRSAANAATANV